MSSPENGGPQAIGPEEAGAGAAGRGGPPTALKPGKKKEDKAVPPQKLKRQSLQAQQKQERLDLSKKSSRTPSPQPQQLQPPQQQQQLQPPQQQQGQPQQRQPGTSQQQPPSQPIQIVEPAVQTRSPSQQQQRQQQQQLSQPPQQQQQSRSQSQPPQRLPPQPQRRSRSQQAKKSKKKAGCCSCCGKKEVSKGRNVTDSEAEDDASHIAALSKQQSSRTRQGRSSGCLCCRKKRQASSSSKSTTKTPADERRKNCKKCCKSFLAFIFSHVGLCSLVVAYSIMGGFLFQWLESSDEIQQRIGVTKKRNNSVFKLWNMTRELNILHEPNWTMMADEVMREFQAQVYVSIKEGGWDGRDETNEEMQWSFSGSLLYSITVITTIGYGHIAPKTDMGRLVTMFYALVGIPLTLLCLSNIGSFFANCFRFLYKQICNALVSLCCPRPRRRPKYHGSTSTMTTSASMKSVASKKSKSMRDVNAEYEESRQALRNKDNADISLVEKGLHLGNGSRDGRACRSFEEIAASVDDAAPKKKQEEIRVPMIVSLIIVAGYIFGGAVLFSLWEDDWNYLIGSYFCFVTLSTIGFGDYVFGVGSDLANNEKMIICALYLVLGLSIIAMCFNLMQEEVRLKCRWLGTKLGIIETKHKPGRR